MDRTERLTRTRQAMERERLDALVLRLPENVLLLSGWWPMIGQSALLFPREGEAKLLVPECYLDEVQASAWGTAQLETFSYGFLNSPDPAEALSKWLREHSAGKGWSRIGYEGSFAIAAPSFNSAEFFLPSETTRALYQHSLPNTELIDAAPFLTTERMRKTPFEAARIRRASEISNIGIAAFAEAVAPGRTGLELSALVEHAIMTRGTGMQGASRVRAYAQVATGPRETTIANRPNEISTMRPLQNGDIALLELGVVADGYWADRTRPRAAGKPTDEQLRVSEVVQRAKAAATAVLRPGAQSGDVDEAARNVIRDAGYGDQFPHITGHGVGFGYHEFNLIIGPGRSQKIEEGMITTIEPGIYFEPMGGLRIEDDVLVTEAGAEILGPHAEAL